MYDVVIIGSGIVGAMTARKLSQYNLKICIVERENDVAMGATKANSAIIHAGFDAKTGSLMAKLNVKGSEMMAEICHDLSVDYKNNGALVIGYTDEDKERLEELFNRGKANGVKNSNLLTKINFVPLSQIFPTMQNMLYMHQQVPLYALTTYVLLRSAMQWITVQN